MTRPVDSVSEPRVLAVVGPTGAGKSALGVELALRLGGEVVNADSMQLYRGMDIGTAKVTVSERRGIPHHLLDLWDVTEPADVARYQRSARQVIDELLAAGRVPILVGGSGLYVRAVLDEFDFPGTDPARRAELEDELRRDGPAPLHERLARLDPAAAAAILPSNGRRIVRALEVVGIRGSFQATLPGPRPFYDALQVGIDRPDLDERIDQRTRRMFDDGLVDEVKALIEAGLREGRTASRALGYAQVLEALDFAGNEALDVDAALRETARATRRFARRQRSWFRRDPRVQWLLAPSVHDAELPVDSRRDVTPEGELLQKVVTRALNWWNVSHH